MSLASVRERDGVILASGSIYIYREMRMNRTVKSDEKST